MPRICSSRPLAELAKDRNYASTISFLGIGPKPQKASRPAGETSVLPLSSRLNK